MLVSLLLKLVINFPKWRFHYVLPGLERILRKQSVGVNGTNSRTLSKTKLFAQVAPRAGQNISLAFRPAIVRVLQAYVQLVVAEQALRSK
jgi:hypothetical protein